MLGMMGRGDCCGRLVTWSSLRWRLSPSLPQADRRPWNMTLLRLLCPWDD